MDWTPGNMSNDIEDRRSSGGGFGFGGLGIAGLVVLIVVSLVTGRNFFSVRSVQSAQQMRPVAQSHGAAEDRDAHLISYVLDDVQQQWTQIFAKQGKQYRHAKLVLFRGSTYSGCGTARAATGPFYCPADEKVYIDLDFWDALRHFGGSTADFAQAYVIAHELGHHVQKLMGIEAKVAQLEQREPGERTHLSIDTELQADCYAGVWAHSAQARGKVHEADIASALSAAAAVGDDHLQKMTGRAVSPEKWTHGSAAQRTAWFRRGLASGDMASCNTFGGGSR
jgi:predicted metalloprotease